jgi:hypothetical protein
VLEAVAAPRGGIVVATYNDNGIMVPQAETSYLAWNAPLKDATYGRFNVAIVSARPVAGGSITQRDLYLDQQVIDTTTAPRRMFFHVTGACADDLWRLLLCGVPA